MSLFDGPNDEVFRLFYPDEMDHVCELIANTYDRDPASNLTKNLHDWLLHPLHRFIERARGEKAGKVARSNLVGIDEAQQLLMVLAGIVDGFDSGRALTASQAKHNAEKLRSVWVEFIARSAAYRLYADLPAELSRKDAISERNSKSAKRPRRTRKAEPQRILDAFVKLRDSGTPERDIRGKLVTRFGVSRSTINRATEHPPPKKPAH